MRLQFQPLGDTGVRIGFGNRIDPEINRAIRSFSNQLKQTPIAGVVEWVPAYTSLTVYYRPWDISYPALLQALKEIDRIRKPVPEADLKTIDIPVFYGGEYGPDLEDVARINGLHPEEVIQIHSEPVYLVYMLGFAPGFPYLGGLSQKIATPRLEKPRARIPAGSVGIAGSQTGVYPLETPGGWRIIGRTSLRLYDPKRKPPVLLKAGDSIRFCPVTQEEYPRIEGGKENADEVDD